jgi:hypothetical protein
MKISILTPDTKKYFPNLAAMKISAFWKSMGAAVFLNFPLQKADYTYASVLFTSTHDPIADEIGGPKYPHIKLSPEIDAMKPDYSLYPWLDYSVGYTYRACPRSCDFCIVQRQKNDETHYSIWSFHDEKFKKIGLLNNNTLADIYWRETFQEIWDAKLTVIDLSGFDARLITEESAYCIANTKFQGQIHIAWDFIEHEAEVVRGINHLLKAGVKANRITCYVLMGYSTTESEDLYRLRVLRNYGILAFAMPFNKNIPKYFLRCINKPQINKGLDFGGNTYESIRSQIIKKEKMA